MAATSESVVDFSAVHDTFGSLSEAYQSAEPFPHVSIPSMFEDSILREIRDEFPRPEDMGGRFSGTIEGGKFTESNFASFGPMTQQFVAACNSGPFLQSMSKLTGIDGLISDPYLTGGGQHQTGTGGRLKVHSDFNVHPFLPLSRRLNMLVYLNDPWDDSWGGALELWDREMTHAVVAVPPTFGRVAIFTCSDFSYHGLPDPLGCPDGTFRRSLAFYYYTADGETPDPRSTLWKERPGENFLSRPRARLKRSAGHMRRAIRTLAKGE